MDNKEGVWRTIRGRRVFIAKGESLGQAMSKSGKFKREDIREGKHQARLDTALDKNKYASESKRHKIAEKYHKKEANKEEYDYRYKHNANNQAEKNRINENAHIEGSGQTRIQRNWNKYSEADRREHRHELIQKKLAEYKAKKQSNNKIDNEYYGSKKAQLDLEMSKYTSKEKLERAKEKLQNTNLDKEERQYYQNYIEKREGKPIKDILKQSNKKLGTWKINEEGKKEYYERELKDNERGYWTKENGQRVFKENPNYNAKEKLNNYVKEHYEERKKQMEEWLKETNSGKLTKHEEEALEYQREKHGEKEYQRLKKEFLDNKDDTLKRSYNKADPYDDPESNESQRLQDIQRRYDEYLYDTEKRGASYGEIAYVESLRGKDLDDFEKELDDYETKKYSKQEKATKKTKQVKSNNDWLPKATEIKEQGTSNRKQVSDNIQAHILEYYSPDYIGEDISPEKAFVRQMEAMKEPTMWKSGQKIAEGGSYLVYNQDMSDFLDSLKINPKGKKFSEDKAFQMYTSLIGRESEKLYNKIKKHEQDTINAYKKRKGK